MRIQHTVHIGAPPERVWAALIDVERWPEFAPPFQRIERLDPGPLALGSRARVTPRGFVGAVWTVARFQEGRSFAWEAAFLPGVRVSADHVLEPGGPGSRLTDTLDLTGPAAGTVSALFGWMLRRNLRQEMEGMKAFCERPA